MRNQAIMSPHITKEKRKIFSCNAFLLLFQYLYFKHKKAITALQAEHRVQLCASDEEEYRFLLFYLSDSIT